MTKRLFAPAILLVALLLSACGNHDKETASPSAGASAPSGTPSASDSTASGEAGTVTYASERGSVEVPAHPKRIVALSYAPNVLSLGGTIVAVDQWSAANPLFKDKLAGVPVVSEDDLEKIIEADPDLIIAGTEMKNLDKLSDIAPTVAFTWGKLDYLAQQVAVGKLLGQEPQAQAWADDFQRRAADIGSRIKAKEGEDVTVSVFETDAKNFYVFGNNFARGTEVLYQAMGLNMPEKVAKDALGPGYYTLSTEVLADYAGDYLVVCRPAAGDNSFMKTESWNSIPAVKNGHVIEVDAEASSYSDPTTLEYLMNIFKEGFLGSAS